MPKIPKYKRLILKISGEALRNEQTGDPIDGSILNAICKDLKDIHKLGVQIGLVVGGGNIFRGQVGAEIKGVDRTTGDYMGMLSTVINGLAFMDCLEKMGVDVRVQTAIPMDQVAEPFILRKATRHMDKGRLVIFVAGTGNPYFSTDTTAALRASEIGAEIVLKATNVDGIFTQCPRKNPKATQYTSISFLDALKNRISVMDSTAFSLCLDNKIPILVFNLKHPGNIKKAIMGESIGTFVS